ncbi:MAG: LolA-related protein [Acetobacteraceae bacterium]
MPGAAATDGAPEAALMSGAALKPGAGVTPDAEAKNVPRDTASTEVPSDAALLATIMRHLAAVRQSHAVFVEEKTLAALRTPLQSSGRLAYHRPDRLEKITDWPQPEVLAVQAGRLSLTADGATRSFELAAEPVIGALVEAILGTLAGDLAGLRRWYHVTATGTQAAWRLALRPRTAALAKFIRGATITGSGGQLTRLRTVAANGDISVMTIRPAA